MSQATQSRDSTTARPPSPARGPRTALQDSRMKYSRALGALFLGGFLAYGTGSAIVTSLAGHPDALSTIGPAGTLLSLAAILILLNSAVDVAKAVLFFPILERNGKKTALTYLATMIVEVVFLSIGALAVLMIAPLAEHASGFGTATLDALLIQVNATAYQIGEMALGVGATFLCLHLFRTGLVPRWLAVSGLIGYPCLVAGTVAELFGVHVGLALTMPGFFFELVLPVWLLTKGFAVEAYRGRAPVPAAGRP